MEASKQAAVEYVRFSSSLSLASAGMHGFPSSIPTIWSLDERNGIMRENPTLALLRRHHHSVAYPSSLSSTTTNVIIDVSGSWCQGDEKY
jgi:hypothetical protein